VGNIRLEDIARVVGVSKNTVSKALRNADGVSDEVRSKIIDTATEMGYKRVISKEINNVTVLCREDFFREPTFWPNILYGIEKAARSRNIKLSTTAIDIKTEEEQIIPYTVDGKIIDGVIIVGTLNNGFIKKIKATDIPLVVVDHYSEEIQCDYVNTANKRGIYQALKYLYKNGHKKIGFIGNNEWAYSFRSRYEAFIYYMKLLDLELDNDYIWLDIKLKEVDFVDNMMYFKEKIKYNDDFPTAWICSNDKIAFAFIKGLRDIGINVPREVSVIGFDNIEIAGIFHPALTTVNVHKRAMGEKALDQLLFRISNKNEPYEFIEIDTNLVVRDSTKKHQ
jgi:LacI family transcriptional regulator